MPAIPNLAGQTPLVPQTVYLSEITLKPLLHGLAQGGISTLEGGDFVQGFLSGSFSSAVGPIIGSLGAGSAPDGVVS